MDGQPTQLTMTLAEVAREFRRSPRWFDARRAALEAEGFPHRIPGTRALWSRYQVEAWFRAPGGHGSDTGSDDVEGLIAAARSSLEARYMGGRP